MGAPAAILKQSSDDRAGGGQCEPASAMVPRFRFCCQRSYRGEGSQGQGLFIILRKNCVIYLFIHFLLKKVAEKSLNQRLKVAEISENGCKQKVAEKSLNQRLTVKSC